MKAKARVIAMYLPQYHPTEINDLWWGKGFTEWTNVAQAKPLFKGHQQPNIPADLGFYDLRLPIIREQQAELAREAGIEGFMYWHYWFGNGKQVLQDIFEEVLESGKPDFPFCLGWANHSWTNLQWQEANLHAKRKGVLEMEYPGVDDYVNHFYYCLKAFKDKRYIRVDGKPFFLIWDAITNKEDIKKIMQTWRKLAIENGLPGIHFVGKETMKIKHQELFDMGFDAVYQAREELAINGAENWTLWHRIHERLIKTFHIAIGLNKADFGKNYKLLANEDARKDNVYPQLCAGFDRSPRSGKKAQIFYNFTPDTWRKHIQHVFSFIKEKKAEHNIVILKSWNEWAESNYMEPDLRYGHAKIDILREELENL